MIAGEAFGTHGPVRDIVTAPLFLDIALAAGARLQVPLPAQHTAFVYTFEGAGVRIVDSTLDNGELGVLGAGDMVELAAGADAARLILVAAQPLREPVARWGPFVMNTPQEIQQALADYRDGRL